MIDYEQEAYFWSLEWLLVTESNACLGAFRARAETRLVKMTGLAAQKYIHCGMIAPPKSVTNRNMASIYSSPHGLSPIVSI